VDDSFRKVIPNINMGKWPDSKNGSVCFGPTEAAFSIETDDTQN
jgi:hypothetical protein